MSGKLLTEGGVYQCDWTDAFGHREVEDVWIENNHDGKLCLYAFRHPAGADPLSVGIPLNAKTIRAIIELLQYAEKEIEKE